MHAVQLIATDPVGMWDHSRHEDDFTEGCNAHPRFSGGLALPGAHDLSCNPLQSRPGDGMDTPFALHSCFWSILPPSFSKSPLLKFHVFGRFFF